MEGAETGCRETDGDKEMQNERGTPQGERTQRLRGWRASEVTETKQKGRAWRRGGNECEVAVLGIRQHGPGE